jgi:hypothetical protein
LLFGAGAGALYAPAITEAARNQLLAAGKALLASDMWHRTGAQLGGVLLQVGAVLVCIAMLRTPQLVAGRPRPSQRYSSGVNTQNQGCPQFLRTCGIHWGFGFRNKRCIIRRLSTLRHGLLLRLGWGGSSDLRPTANGHKHSDSRRDPVHRRAGMPHWRTIIDCAQKCSDRLT